MDNKQLFLFIALALVLLLIWQAWQQDYGVRPAAPQSPVATQPAAPDVPNVAPPAAPPSAGVPAPVPGEALESGQRVTVVTDVVRAELDTVGGDLRRLDLLAYPVAVDKPREPFRLFNDQLPRLFVAQSGALAQADGADHHVVFNAPQTHYQLAAGAQTLEVPLRWVSPAGVVVTKVYTFRRGSYEINIEYRIENAGAQPWRGRLYGQFQRTEDPSGQSHFIYTYTGGVLNSPENKYEKITLEDMAEQGLSRDVQGGWAAMLQHYFVAAWIPARDQVNHYYAKGLDGPRYVLGVLTPEQSIPAGQSGKLGIRLYAGPKLQDHLQEVAPGLELTVDYGLLTILAQPIFWLLKYIHKVVGNWGWAIVLLTLLIKLAFYKLSAASYRSMANMRRLQPRMAALKERHGDDRQKMSQAMMELYKTEKINPLGGCLPVLVQIPVFIALYWVLLESVELRQADFILWINDLSSPDPYYILPLLMGITMFIQQKLSPAPPDPLQAKVMMILPPVFTLFFAFFPAGLVLYWVANNALSIAQQWYITKKVASDK